MSRFASIAFAAAFTALSSAIALPAFAATAQQDHAAKHEKGDKADKKFPMPAADFRAHMSKKMEKARARMESHISKKQLPQDKADEARAKFNAAAARINEKVEAVCADGTVTKEEAHEVHALAKSLHHGHKKENPTLVAQARGVFRR